MALSTNASFPQLPIVTEVALATPAPALLTNLIKNPSFEYDTVGGAPAWWQNQATTFIVQKGWAASGLNALHITGSVTGSFLLKGALSPPTTATAPGQYLQAQATFNVLNMTFACNTVLGLSWPVWSPTTASFPTGTGYYTTSATSGVKTMSLRCGLPTPGNLVPDPSFEHDTPGAPIPWAGVQTGVIGITATPVTASTAQHHTGTQSMAVTTPGGANSQGAHIALGPRPAAVPITASAWIFVSVTQSMGMAMEDNSFGFGPAFAQVSCTGGVWTQIAVTWTPTAFSANAMLYIYAIAGSTAQTFFVDDVAVNEGTNVYPYADGDSTGWAWVGTAGNSASYATFCQLWAGIDTLNISTAMSYDLLLDSVILTTGSLTAGSFKNFILNPSFEYDTVGARPEGWTNPGGAVFAVQNGWSQLGTNSLRITSSALGAAGQQSAQVLGGGISSGIPVIGFQRYTFSGWVNRVSSGGTSLTYLQINWLDSAGTFIGATTSAGGGSIPPSSFSAGAGTGINHDFLSVITPFNALYAQLFLVQNGGASGGTADAYFDGLLFNAGGYLGAYFDGDTNGFTWVGTPGNSISTNVVASASSTNLVPNPSFEYDTIGSGPAAWAPSIQENNPGAVLTAQGPKDSVSGSKVMVITTTAASASQGAEIVMPGPFVAGLQSYTLSMYIKGEVGGENFAIGLGVPGDLAQITRTITTNWTRWSATWTPLNTHTNVGIFIQHNVASVATIFIDAVMVTPGIPLQVYNDGDSAGWTWTGSPGNSISNNLVVGGSLNNLIANPSFEYDSNGTAPAVWAASLFSLNSGATLTAVNTQHQLGTQALQVVTTNALFAEGACCACPSIGTFKAGVTYAASVWVKGNVGGELIDVVLGSTGDDNAFLTGANGLTLTTNWQLVTGTWTPSANRSATNHGIAIRSHAAAVIAFFVDSVIMVQANTVPTYNDGDSVGWSWLGIPGNSVSTNIPSSVTNLLYFDGDTPASSWSGTLGNSISTQVGPNILLSAQPADNLLTYTGSFGATPQGAFYFYSHTNDDLTWENWKAVTAPVNNPVSFYAAASQFQAMYCQYIFGDGSFSPPSGVTLVGFE